MAGKFSRPLALLSLAVLSACGGAASSGGSGAKAAYSFYFISDLTTTSASTAQPMLSAVRAYFEYTNRHGGADGHKLNLATLDDAMDVGKVKINVQQAQTAGALAILGANNSSGWSPNGPFITQTQISAIGLGFTDPQLDPNTPFLYGLSPSYLQMSNMDFKLLSDTLIKNGQVPAKPRVSFLHYTSAAVATMVAFYKQIIQTNGYTFVTDQSFPLTATDVSSQASAIVQGKTDVVIGNFIDSNAPLAVKALREKGYSGPVINFSGASSPSTFSALKDPLYYSLRVYYATTDNAPGVATVTQRAKEVGITDNLTNLYFSYGWVNAAIAVAGVKKCSDGCDAVKYSKALEGVGRVDVNGLNPNVQITAGRHRAVDNGIYFHWDNSRSVEVPIGAFISGS
jgi:branched-chain amino acid transport system substrate-binding protein